MTLAVDLGRKATKQTNKQTIYKLFKSHANCALMCILRILGPIKFCKGPIKISNGQFKFGNLHVFEWDMGNWPILRPHHQFGLGLSLPPFYSIGRIMQWHHFNIISIPRGFKPILLLLIQVLGVNVLNN